MQHRNRSTHGCSVHQGSLGSLNDDGRCLALLTLGVSSYLRLRLETSGTLRISQSVHAHTSPTRHSSFDCLRYLLGATAAYIIRGKSNHIAICIGKSSKLQQIEPISDLLLPGSASLLGIIRSVSSDRLVIVIMELATRYTAIF